MMTASEFADAVGRKTLADTFGVGLTAVSNAVVRGRFPASWFSTSRILAESAGVDCPPELFSQKGAASHLVDLSQESNKAARGLSKAAGAA